MLCVFENDVFPFFSNIYLNEEVATILQKARQSFQNCLNSKFVVGGSLENGFQATLKKKQQMFGMSENNIFHIFGNF